MNSEQIIKGKMRQARGKHPKKGALDHFLLKKREAGERRKEEKKNSLGVRNVKGYQIGQEPCLGFLASSLQTRPYLGETKRQKNFQNGESEKITFCRWLQGQLCRFKQNEEAWVLRTPGYQGLVSGNCGGSRVRINNPVMGGPREGA